MNAASSSESDDSSVSGYWDVDWGLAGGAGRGGGVGGGGGGGGAGKRSVEVARRLEASAPPRPPLPRPLKRDKHDHRDQRSRVVAPLLAGARKYCRYLRTP